MARLSYWLNLHFSTDLLTLSPKNTKCLRIRQQSRFPRESTLYGQLGSVDAVTWRMDCCHWRWVDKLIGAALCKTCQFDPAPTRLVKDMCGHLSPFISFLFNKSLATGCFLSKFKKATVRPLLKKVEPDAHSAKNTQAAVILTIPLQVTGKNNSKLAACFLGQQRFDATLTICVSQYWDSCH